MLSKRKSKRLEVEVPLRLTLLGISKSPPTIETTTTNISSMGIAIQLQVSLSNGVVYMHQGEKQFDLIPYLVLVKREVAVEITLPPHDKKITGKGKVIWYDFGSQEGSYYFRAGIFLKEMEHKDSKTWKEFVRHKALKMGRGLQSIQIASVFTFIAGIVIFIAGSGGKLAAIAKTGFFVSLIGFIGFVIGWWRHRSFMLFKKFL